MTALIPLQVTSFLEVVPPWLPPVAIATGHILLLVGMGSQFFDGKLGHWSAYSSAIGRLCAILLTASVAIASYITVLGEDLVLSFAFLTFMSGRFIQGAITLRFVQKILDFVNEQFTEDAAFRKRTQTDIVAKSRNLVGSGVEFVGSKIRDYIVILAATGLITTHTSLSIVSVYVFGDGSTLEAVERFWTGFFILTTVGLAFDFRHFAHRLSWVAAFGMVIATAGAFLYSPVGFSTLTAGLAPYLDNPVPDWMRWPLGAAGFLFGALFWMIFYSRKG